MMRTLEIDLCIESDAELLTKLGKQATPAGDVTINSTGHCVGGVVTCTVYGPVTAILAWLVREWEDETEALETLINLAADGKLQ